MQIPTAKEIAAACDTHAAGDSQPIMRLRESDPLLLKLIAELDHWPAQRKGLTVRLRLALTMGLHLGILIGQARART